MPLDRIPSAWNVPRPRIETVRIPEFKIAAALKTLEDHWERPDGENLIDMRAVNACKLQLRNGFYHRLVWPAGTTMAQAREWQAMAEEVLNFRRLGLL